MPTPLDELPIRPLTPRDLLSCVALAVDRGWPPDERKWRLLLTAGNGFGIDEPSGAGLAGACVLTRYGTPGAGPGQELSAVGMLLVATAYERQGLGGRLMRHILGEADGAPLALYATRFGQGLYERLGFVTAGQNVTVKGRLRLSPSSGDPSPAGVTVRTATAEDLPAVAGLDAEVFGVDRTLMITRLPAFAEQLRVAVDGSAIIGFGALWSSASADVIGPLVARDTATAKALIASLADATHRPLRTDIDARHEHLLAWLKEQGMDAVLTTPLMVRDIPALPGDPERRYAPLTMATC
ncbi:GNAT family N-acetyltransferase [Streptomyces fuscigenes]|uniref:GNAT family N-acetyltransferase n=1 Tax=Streptomyces fuscigenes TaxID=1528880 RepID=UPI001F2D4AE2|nr:GNAT family N-acetyltransferase [Streptomyces fuscigenes]MCF3961294.1 GNAT family N-acetyltransferase [Streptomyces fuscigenes]